MEASGNRQDCDVQSMLGIKVTGIDDTRQTVSPSPNGLVESLGSTRAGFLFSMLARYRLVDVVALMEGVCPFPMPILRSPAPSGSIPVRQILRASLLVSVLNLISNCQYFEGLVDWVKVMEEFRDLVIRHIPQNPVGEPHNSNIQLTLLRSLVRTISSQKKAKISTNLLAAAVHLAFLKSAVQNKLVLELPDDPLSFTQRLILSMPS